MPNTLGLTGLPSKRRLADCWHFPGQSVYNFGNTEMRLKNRSCGAKFITYENRALPKGLFITFRDTFTFHSRRHKVGNQCSALKCKNVRILRLSGLCEGDVETSQKLKIKCRWSHWLKVDTRSFKTIPVRSRHHPVRKLPHSADMDAGLWWFCFSIDSSLRSRVTSSWGRNMGLVPTKPFLAVLVMVMFYFSTSI